MKLQARGRGQGRGMGSTWEGLALSPSVGMVGGLLPGSGDGTALLWGGGPAMCHSPHKVHFRSG